jgi:uncharacterized protein YodC (DUF2158 family)
MASSAFRLIAGICDSPATGEMSVMSQRFNIGDQVSSRRGHAMTVFAIHAGMVSVFWRTRDGTVRERALPQRCLHHANGEEVLPMDHEIALAHHGLA